MDKNTLLSSFGKWVSPINCNLLYDQVDSLKLDYYTKILTTESYLKLMVLAHLDERDSLSEMSDALVDEELQKAVGFESISVSQLSRRNNEIPSDVLAKLFFDLVGRIKTFHTALKTSMPLNIIDSTTIVFRNRNKKSDWLAILSTDCTLSDQEINHSKSIRTVDSGLTQLHQGIPVYFCLRKLRKYLILYQNI